MRKHRKIEQCNNSDIDEVLISAYVVVGLRSSNQPDAMETEAYREHIRQHFGQFTLGEFNAAFLLYSQNKLDYKDMLFQNFSIPFMENVMQSYKRLRMTIPRPELQQALPEKTKPTAQEIDLIERNAALKKFQEYKDHMDLWDFGGATFAFLWRLGLIRLTEEERDQLKLKAERELIREAQMEIKNGKRPSEIATVVEAIQAGNDNQVRLRMRKLALMDYFETLIAHGVELKEVLK